jgi:Domain of unknown function (DUF4406)
MVTKCGAAAVISMLEAAGAGEGVVYVATPITTGQRVVEAWAKRVDLSAEAREEVRRSNEERARSVATSVRRRLQGTMVINPADFESGTAEWSQEDFYELWSTVIRRFARRVVLVEGWAFSKGARLEVQIALNEGIPILDEDLFEIQFEELAGKVESADAALNHEDRLGLRLGSRLVRLDRFHTSEIGSILSVDAGSAEAYWWLQQERAYQREKFSAADDDRLTSNGPFGVESPYFTRVGNYVERARIFGLDTMNGRQALGKAAATLAGWLESAVRLYGPMPQPGVPSGDGLVRKFDSRMADRGTTDPS